MPPAKSATISLDQGWRLLRGVLATCDKQELFCHILREHGFSAFDPLLANYFTYVLPVEIEATQKRMAEETKEVFLRELRRPIDGDKVSEAELASPHLAELRRLRDLRNGVPAEDLILHFSEQEAYILHALDEPERRRRADSILNRISCEHKLQKAQEEAMVRLKWEAQRMASADWINFATDGASRGQLFLDTSSSLLKQIGFKSAMSKQRSPLFVRRQLDSEFELRWVLRDVDYLAAWPGQMRPSGFQPALYMCHRKTPANIEVGAQRGQCLRLAYTGLVPFFGNAYLHFYSNEELETIIKAHVFLMQSFIEQFLVVFQMSLK